MSEYPSDEGTPIPFVKIYGDLIVAPAPTVHVGDDVFLFVELINMGTAPSRQGDHGGGSLSFSGTVFARSTSTSRRSSRTAARGGTSSSSTAGA